MSTVLKWIGESARSLLAITALAGMVFSGAAWAAQTYLDHVINAKVTAAIDDFRTEYKCDKLRQEMRRVAAMPDTPATRTELARLQAIYNELNCAKYEVF